MTSSGQLSRREWLRLGAGALLAYGAWPGRKCYAENGRGGTFPFVVINDAHFFTSRCPEWFKRVAASIQAQDPKPEFCLMVGDLAEHGTETELGGMRDVLRSFGIDFYVVIGNHDHLSARNRSAWEKLFPADSLNYSFNHRDWQLVGLDSSDGIKTMHTRIQPATFAWLEDHLPKLDPAAPTIVFTHFPLGNDTQMRPANADDLLERFTKFNLVAVFDGHYHGFTERKSGETVLTTNRCCAISRNNHDGTPEKGYFLCVAREGRIERKFIEVKPDGIV